MENIFPYFYFPVFLGLAPVIVMITFALMDFFTIRTVASHQIHIERLSRERQITAMGLVQVIFIVISTLPYDISTIYTLSSITTDQILIARYYLVNTITILGYYGSYAVSFIFEEI